MAYRPLQCREAVFRQWGAQPPVAGSAEAGKSTMSSRGALDLPIYVSLGIMSDGLLFQDPVAKRLGDWRWPIRIA
jgi:hypothetical protein